MITDKVYLKSYVASLLQLSPVVFFTLINLFLVNNSIREVVGANFWNSDKLWAFNFILYQYILAMTFGAASPRDSSIFMSVYLPNLIFKPMLYILIIGFCIDCIFYLLMDKVILAPAIYLYYVFGPIYFCFIPFHLIIVCLTLILGAKHNKYLIASGVVCLIIVLATSIPWYYKQLGLFMSRYHQGLVI